MKKLLVFSIKHGIFFLCLGLLGLWIYQKPSSMRSPAFFREPNYNYLPQVQQAIAEKDYGTALALIRYVGTQPDLPNRDEIVLLEEPTVEDLNGIGRKVSQAFSGAFTGKVDSIEAFSGAFLADFCVVGDLRDLFFEGRKFFIDEDPDKFIIALSASGLVATISGFLPEPTTTGAGLSAQSFLTILKGLRKAGALTDQFTDELTVIFKNADEVKNAKNLRVVFENFQTIRRHAPPGTASLLMRKVRTRGDLALVAKAVERFPDETVTLFKIGGDDAMDFLKTLDETKPGLIGDLLRKGPRHLFKAKLALRGTKFVKNGRPGQARDLFAEWLMNNPWVRRCLLVVSALFVGLGLRRIVLSLVEALSVSTPSKKVPA